jgi:hypothetical protein
MSILLIDGIRYKPWTPKDEEKEFHPLVKKQSKEIFGKNTVYFDLKAKLTTTSGKGSVPDAIVIDLTEPYQWYIVENELSSHSIYDHIVPQLTKFIKGLKNPNSINRITEMLYDEIRNDNSIRSFVLAKINSDDIHHFLSRLLSKPSKIVIVIDEKTPEVEEAFEDFKVAPEIIEFKTFVKENSESVFAHLLKPMTTDTSSMQSLHNIGLKGQQYLNFYQEITERFKLQIPKAAVAKPKPQNYSQIGSPSLHFEWRFTGKKSERTFLVELHFESSKREVNLARINEFKKYKQDIEKATGETVYFQENWSSSWARLYIERKETEMNEELKKWAVEKMVALYNLLQPKLATMKQ